MGRPDKDTNPICSDPNPLILCRFVSCYRVVSKIASPTGNEVPNSVINLALESIIKEGQATELCFNDVKLRLDALKARYTLFNEITMTHGVRWMVHDNVVIADELVWSKLLKLNHYNLVYYNFDERNIKL